MSSSLPPAAPPRVQPVDIASYLLIAGGLLLVMLVHLLAGLLCVCVGFLLTRRLSIAFDALAARLRPKPSQPAQCSGLARVLGGRWMSALAAAIVILAPLLILTGALTQSREVMLHAPAQYRELLDYTAHTVLELRQKLPASIGAYLPDGAADLQRLLAHFFSTQAGTLAHTGRLWINALIHAYVGLIIGALVACRPRLKSPRPLVQSLHTRIMLFGEAFRQIIAAQFWIAALNTLLTAIFLLVVLPLWQARLPYTPALIMLTFLAGLVPIVGNLLCNTVMTLVALSVSPLTGVACLLFLILIHKVEYVINAKIVGQRTRVTMWELLTAMFVAEAIFGPGGLVAAPLFYAYMKKELQRLDLV
ncbi:MAG: AI-2E family transporter [Burkholderiaceae bacterium]|jgi:predicted PurR-regulated permease PerM|nr:AI-2E family transporter [Burkholderiaceae bacterium]